MRTDEARFLTDILVDDRERITYPFVVAVDNARWIVATDGHRLHAVRCAEANDFPVGSYVLVSRMGDVAPLARTTTPPPVKDGAWCSGRRTVPVETYRLKWVASIRSDIPPGRGGGPALAFGEDVRDPYLWFAWQTAAAGSVGVNPRYVDEALALAIGSDGVLIGRGGPEDAVTIEAMATKPSWRAVIMPVRL